MSITSISSYSSYASMETYASTAAVGNGDQAASAVFLRLDSPDRLGRVLPADHVADDREQLRGIADGKTQRHPSQR
jgi:hypothetical protein